MGNIEKIEMETYKREFYEEIRNIDVQVQDLKDLKISDNTLAAEIALRKILGDEISRVRMSEDGSSGEKTITKLDEGAIEFDSVVRKICNDIEDPEFDSSVELFMSSVSQEWYET